MSTAFWAHNLSSSAKWQLNLIGNDLNGLEVTLTMVSGVAAARLKVHMSQSCQTENCELL